MPVLETTLAVGCLKNVGGLIPQCIPQEVKDKLARPVSYVFCYSCNVKNIRDKISDLRKAHDEIEKQVHVEETNRRNVKPEVQEWLKETAILLGKFYAKIETKVDNQDSNNCCSDSACEIGEMTDCIEKLLQQKKGFQILSYTRDPFPVNSMYNMDSTNLLSRQQTMEKVLKVFDGRSNHKIVICGLPGSGKTTMLKNIVCHYEIGKQFQFRTEVIDNSSIPDIKKIQTSIASQIGLVFDRGDSKECRAALLHPELKSRLEKGKRILVVLDDICHEINEICKEVGIPFSPEEEHSCTILMSSRNLEGNGHFQLGCLNEVDAKRLFRHGLCNQIPNKEYYQSLEFTSMENDVLKKCAGLPSAITELSRVIKERWQHRNEIVDQLQHRHLSEVDYVDQKTHKSIKRSYELLKVANNKKLFLLISCLFQPGTSTDNEDFMRYGIGLSLFQNLKHVKDCRQLFDRLVDEMKSLSLLEKKDGTSCISIHNIIQESAISIASKDGYLLLQKDSQPFVDPTTLAEYSIISTCVSYSEKLLGQQLPKLRALLLKGNSSHFSTEEDTYFTEMNKLTVLGLSDIKRLPSSIEQLKNLMTLSVENSEIEDASMIGKLPFVVILSFRGSEIKVFPKGTMNRLMLLDLTECLLREVIGDVVANSYPSLEELYMCGCTFVEDTMVEVVTESLVGKLGSLEYALEIEIPATCVPAGDVGHLLLGKKLERFRIAIGCKLVLSSFMEYKRVLLFEGIEVRLVLGESLLCLLEKTECLRLERIGDLSKVIYDMGMKLGQLKWLHIGHCDGMKCLFNTVGMATDYEGLPELETLILEQLDSLEVIEQGSRQDSSNQSEEIVSADVSSISYGSMLFPKLKHIKLQNLAMVSTFSSRKYKSTLPALEKVEIHTCPSLKSFSYGELHTPNLKSVQVNGEKSEEPDIDLNTFIQLRNTGNPAMSQSVPSFEEPLQPSAPGVEQQNEELKTEVKYEPPEDVTTLKSQVSHMIMGTERSTLRRMTTLPTQVTT